MSNNLAPNIILLPATFFFLTVDVLTMLTEHQVTHVSNLDFKKTPVYINWNFPI